MPYEVEACIEDDDGYVEVIDLDSPEAEFYGVYHRAASGGEARHIIDMSTITRAAALAARMDELEASWCPAS